MDIVRSRPNPIPAPLARPDAAPARARDLAGPAASDAPDAARPSLWHVLTPEERAFFEQAGGMGPLTYRPGPQGAEPPATPTGGRIDVRG